ncbi:MAG: SWIM zinc finger family protein, partial [Moorea sp. SIO3C2]|nr:SWIM zinc finger family protein [Moorena sp. SIO3C2]
QSQDDLQQRAENADPLVEAVIDTWQILGKLVIDEDNLQIQRTWLWGTDSQKAALVLKFAHGRQPLDVSLVPGTSLKGKLIFYPGTGLQRAFVAVREDTTVHPPAPTGVSIETAIQHYAQALSQNPWLERFPLVLSQVSPYPRDDGWWLQDSNHHALPMAYGFQRQWDMVSIGGGYPITVFGEWDGTTFLPLSLWAGPPSEPRFYPLGD